MIQAMSELQTSVQFLTGVGPKKASLLKTELAIETLSDLIHLYPTVAARLRGRLDAEHTPQ